eukprot:CAMPEP_0195078362 /NCGR_PEP_ID=MMETSP0448-20130528/20562_1 /TAXON_ID=66468 /ORGANISM="Heterocapsa triquestra, Strain CCMP 448" /LENGTH=212 /DNA_ID=CAMNT_0040111095 /DNA_START=7 /DNA_END=645 /DNA_ORIENTATION=-
MNPASFAAQIRAQAHEAAQVHAAAAQERHAANAGTRKRYACIALLLHIVLAVVVAGLTWALYYLLKATTEPKIFWGPEGQSVEAENPWPMWVNWIVMVVILGSPLFTLVSILPLLCSCRLWPAWNIIVVGNLVVVNVMLWIIYGISACQVYRYSFYSYRDGCDFPWPAITTALSVVVVVITSAIACFTHRPSSPAFTSDVETGAVKQGVVIG